MVTILKIIPHFWTLAQALLQPVAQAVKYNIKDTNEFLKSSVLKLPDGIILCTMDILGSYPNIPHGDGLSALRKRL